MICLSRRLLSSLLIVLSFQYSAACQPDEVSEPGRDQQPPREGGEPADSPSSPPKPESPAILADLRTDALNSVERRDRLFAWAEQNYGDSATPYLDALEGLEEHLTVVELHVFASASIERTQSMAELSGLIDNYYPVSGRGSRYARLIYEFPLERVSEVEAVFAEMGPGEKRKRLVSPLVIKRLKRDSLLDTAKWISELPYPEDRKRAWPTMHTRVEKGVVPKEELAVLLELTDHAPLRTKIETLLEQQ